MSEKIYAFLLRLYPSGFRKAYGGEAMQLVRDRLRNEKGLVGRLRLWLDLLADFAMSLPREYRYAQPMLASSSTQRRLDGVPSFHLLEDQPLGVGTLLAAVLSFLVVLGTLSIMLKHAGDHRRSSDSVMQGSPARTRWAASPGSSARLDGSGSRATATVSQPSAQPAVAPSGAVASSGLMLDSVERQRVIDAAVANLKKHYFDPDGAEKIANALLAHEKNGDYNAIADGQVFAKLVTQQMRDVGQDVDLTMEYSRARLPDQPQAQTPEDLARYRNFLEQNQCFFKKAEILPHAIGYLKLDGFADLSVCRSTAVAAMASLNGANAVIFDLRDNSGGDPAMVSLIAAYLFDHPEYWYSPRAGPTPQSWTQSPVPGNRLADKPVYLLTSASTWSAGEQFSYDLKMLKRATLVGETTRGGAHAGVWHRIDDHFGMGIPEVRVVNPYAKNDWEGAGVEPDVKVRAADALTAAEKLAESKLRPGGRSPDLNHERPL
jgi:hypothetical protein